MGNAARAYTYDAAAPARRTQPEPRPSFLVVPGQGKQQQRQEGHSYVIFVASALIVGMVAVALFGFARIFLASETVSVSLEAQQISQQIDSARAEGSMLEVQQSTLSQPTRIKEEATALGMAAPIFSESISLEPDVVKTDAQGTLLLSDSLTAAASR